MRIRHPWCDLCSEFRYTDVRARSVYFPPQDSAPSASVSSYGPCRQCRPLFEDLDAESCYQFFSCGTDGRVLAWDLKKMGISMDGLNISA